MSIKKNQRNAALRLATADDRTDPTQEPAGHDESIDTIGIRIREERTKAGLSVRGLAREAGVSPSLISQIELGRVQPSVDTLYSIANALGITVDILFTESEQAHPQMADPGQFPGADPGAIPVPGVPGASAVPGQSPQPQGVVRSGKHRRIRLAGGVQWELLTPATDRNIEFMRVTYEPGAESCPPDALLRHGGLEYVYILSGTLGLQIGFDEYEMTAGDSAAFRADNPHRLWAIGDEPAVALWVILNRQNDDRTPRA